jgi:hypothetical protein
MHNKRYALKLAAQFEQDPSQKWCRLILRMGEMAVVVDASILRPLVLVLLTPAIDLGTFYQVGREDGFAGAGYAVNP